jgi:hypothetical protein
MASNRDICKQLTQAETRRDKLLSEIARGNDIHTYGATEDERLSAYYDVRKAEWELEVVEKAISFFRKSLGIV